MSILFRGEFNSTMRNSLHYWGQIVLCRYIHTNYYDALTRFSSQKPNILHWFYSSLFGCMKHNCSGSHYAEHTSYNPQKMQSLLENHMCQSCTAYKQQNPQPKMFTLDSPSHHLPPPQPQTKILTTPGVNWWGANLTIMLSAPKGVTRTAGAKA